MSENELIAQNANPRLKNVALAQTYFAVKTRQQESTEEQYKQLTKDEKRLYNRKNKSKTIKIEKIEYLNHFGEADKIVQIFLQKLYNYAIIRIV